MSNTTRKPHPHTGAWQDVPAGVWMDAREVAAIVKITSKAVTNRFQKGRCPEGWTVARKPGANWYMRVRLEAASD